MSWLSFYGYFQVNIIANGVHYQHFLIFSLSIIEGQTHQLGIATSRKQAALLKICKRWYGLYFFFTTAPYRNSTGTDNRLTAMILTEFVVVIFLIVVYGVHIYLKVKACLRGVSSSGNRNPVCLDQQ